MSKQAQFQRRGRATLLWALATLALVQTGLRVAIDNVWPTLRDPTFEIKAGRLARLIAKSPEPPITVLAFGSSVVSNCFRAKQIEDRLTNEFGRPAVVMNMASNGGGPLTALVWTKRLLQRGIRLDVVCVEINPFIYKGLGAPGDAGRFLGPMVLASDLEVLARYGGDPELPRQYAEFRWFPAYHHRLTILNVLNANLVPAQDRVQTWNGKIDDRFWAELPSCSSEQRQAATKQAADSLQNELRDFTPNERTVQALDELLDLLGANETTTIVVVTPQSEAVRKLYHEENLRRLLQRVHDSCNRRGQHFVNLSACLPDERFNDGVHPVAEGATTFSQRFGDEVLTPLLSQQVRKSPWRQAERTTPDRINR